jgi:F-box protein 16
MAQCRPRQLTYARNLLTKRFPAQHQDFTRLFPRVLCLYIFSFLDPRSLCRCAQVNYFFFLLSNKFLFLIFLLKTKGLLVLEIFI